ncbi:MAG: helix-turn-helix domain-containing protein, partial [Kiritimatiellia bacterium]
MRTPDLNELLEAKEGEHVEFKEAKNRFDFVELVKYACAIANEGGGYIVLGVTDKRPRQVVGSEAFDQPERTRAGLMERLHLRVDFHLLQHDGKR